jgi:hypothetical protein
MIMNLNNQNIKHKMLNASIVILDIFYSIFLITFQTNDFEIINGTISYPVVTIWLMACSLNLVLPRLWVQP